MKKMIFAVLCGAHLVLSNGVWGIDIQKSFEEGMALKKSEKFSEAAEFFSKIVSEDPKNADALQQLATLLGWLGRYDESVSVWIRAVEINGNNIEYRVGLARVYSWKGDLKAAKSEYIAALNIDPNDLDSLKGLKDLEARMRPPLLWRVDAGFSYDGYKNSPIRVAEKNTYAQIGRQLNPMNMQSSAWIRHEWQSHFQMTDNTIYAGGSLNPLKSLAIQYEMGWTGTPNFQPTQSYNTNIDLILGKWVIPNARYKHMVYRDGNVDIYTTGLRLQILPQAAFTYRFSVSKNITGPDTEGWFTQFDYDTGENLTGYLGYTQGNESLPPLSTAFNESIFTGIIYQLNQRWSWRVDYSYENRPNFYYRSSIGSGITYKF